MHITMALTFSFELTVLSILHLHTRMMFVLFCTFLKKSKDLMHEILMGNEVFLFVVCLFCSFLSGAI